MKYLSLLMIPMLFWGCSAKKSNEFDFKIPFEVSKGTKTATYEETILFCKSLEKASEFVKYEVFGITPQGRDLPLLIVDKNMNFTPDKVRASGNAVLMIEANIHPGEPDGNDAGMLLLRDILISKEKIDLLDHLTILFLPAFNADGLARFGPYNRINQNGPEQMGWRTNAQNLNLNRDFLKADAPEMQSWLKLFNQWLPDFFVDCHVTDGADYQYVLTYSLETRGNMTQELSQWQKDIYLPSVSKSMDSVGFPIFPYVTFRRWHDPRSGLVSWASNPMLSQGYTAIQNRPGMLLETHMLKPFAKRVEATYQMLYFTAKLLNKESKNLIQLNKISDEFTASADFRKNDFPLSFKPTKDSIMVDFLGVEYDIVESDLTKGLWFQYHTDKPKTYQIPFFDRLVPAKTVKLPEAYLVPPEWLEVIRRIECHGIEFTRLTKDVELEVSSYKFSACNWSSDLSFGQAGPREGRQTVKCSINEYKEKRVFPAGTLLIDMNQRAARVVAHILEPAAPDSYLYWGFFNAVFEQKEYAETYVMEQKAREMLAKDANLKAEFEQWLSENPQFIDNQWVICNWFYEHSPWNDLKRNAYPIGRIMESKELENLKKKEN